MKYVGKLLGASDCYSLLKNEESIEDAMELVYKLFFYYTHNKFDINKEYLQLYTNYETYIKNIGNMCVPYELSYEIQKHFLPYAKDVLYNNYQDSIEEHPLYPNIKAAYDAAIKHYVENPEYYEREDYMGG